MNITQTRLKGCFIIEPAVFEDERGYFFESFNERKLEEVLGYAPRFMQDNQSKSSYGVVRGLHQQLGDMDQAKFVRALEGAGLVVVVDARPDTDRYGLSFSVELSAGNTK